MVCGLIPTFLGSLLFARFNFQVPERSGVVAVCASAMPARAAPSARVTSRRCMAFTCRDCNTSGRGFGSTGIPACAASWQGRCFEDARKRWRRWFDLEYEKNDVARRACLARSCCWDLLAQARLPVLLNGKGAGRRPAVVKAHATENGGTNC